MTDTDRTIVEVELAPRQWEMLFGSVPSLPPEMVARDVHVADDGYLRLKPAQR